MSTKTAAKAITKRDDAGAEAGKGTEVSIPQLQIQTVELKLTGTSPLVVHAWSEKAKQQMRDKQGKKAKQGREAKVPAQDFIDALYWMSPKPTLPSDPDAAYEMAMKAVERGKFGFPTIAFKAAAVSGAGFVDGMTKVGTRGSFHIIGELVEIVGQAPVMREDMVRVGMGTADLRYRPMFEDWSVTLPIQLNRTAMSLEQMVSLFNVGGFACGVGEYRPEKDGSWGRFTVVS